MLIRTFSKVDHLSLEVWLFLYVPSACYIFLSSIIYSCEGAFIEYVICRYDFFIVSQHVRQGTVSPTHYIVVEDGLDLKPGLMQRLTYKMTHLYYNWPGTVRVPAPCQVSFFCVRVSCWSGTVFSEQFLICGLWIGDMLPALSSWCVCTNGHLTF